MMTTPRKTRRNTMEIIVAMGLFLCPVEALAGSYGSAGVKDSSVTLFAPQGHVWCQKLGADIPLELQEHIECGNPSVQIVRSRVANERVTNNRSRGPLGFLRSLRHTPIGHEPEPGGSDNDRSPRVTTLSNEESPGPAPEVNLGEKPQTKDVATDEPETKNTPQTKEAPNDQGKPSAEPNSRTAGGMGVATSMFAAIYSLPEETKFG